MQVASARVEGSKNELGSFFDGYLPLHEKEGGNKHVTQNEKHPR